ncbi:MAG: type IVB secretion system protein IcmH/DotU [Gammaproteobacteria bacterium]
MSSNDPFATLDGSDPTFIKPTPGGRRVGAPAPEVSAPRANPSAQDSVQLPARSGLNPLENAASALLDLVASLKNTHSHSNPGALQRQLISEIHAFDSKARALGVTEDLTLTRARYALCTTIDDIILNTPWGHEFGWSRKTLQGMFFKKEWGGDEFFQLTDKLIQDPTTHRDLLELIYVCLALGFKGGYRVYGRENELEDRRLDLYRRLRALRGELEQELSPHWRGVTDRRNPIMRYVPLWIVAVLAALALLGIFLYFFYKLSGLSTPVFGNLQKVGRDVVVLSRDPAAPPVTTPTAPPDDAQKAHQDLRKRLLAENCLDTGDVIIGTNKVVGTYIRTSVACGILFDSGKFDIKPQFDVILQRIAAILTDTIKRAPGRVLVTGHTDNVPGRFIDNDELSQRRAEAVKQRLITLLGNPGRFTAEGRADKEPVDPKADNNNPDVRARNRRVEIMLLFPNVNL